MLTGTGTCTVADAGAKRESGGRTSIGVGKAVRFQRQLRRRMLTGMELRSRALTNPTSQVHTAHAAGQHVQICGRRRHEKDPSWASGSAQLQTTYAAAHTHHTLPSAAFWDGVVVQIGIALGTEQPFRIG